MILPDYLAEGLDVVFCGTAVGERSAGRGHYYAGHGNKFWRMLHETGLTPERLEPDEDARVLEFGIGLTDLVKLHAGNDNTLSAEMFGLDAFHQRILMYAPRFVAFNGKEATRVALRLRSTKEVRWGIQGETIGRTKFVALPNTSGSANGSWDEKPWHELAALVRKQRRTKSAARSQVRRARR